MYVSWLYIALIKIFKKSKMKRKYSFWFIALKRLAPEACSEIEHHGKMAQWSTPAQFVAA